MATTERRLFTLTGAILTVEKVENDPLKIETAGAANTTPAMGDASVRDAIAETRYRGSKTRHSLTQVTKYNSDTAL